jgi:hypothetical protein
MTSLRASDKGLEIINLARLKKGWSKTSDTWADLADISPGTLKRFWQKKSIRSDSFRGICSTVGILDWREIADFSLPDKSDFKPVTDAYFITGNPILDPKLFFGREMSLKRIFSILNRYPLQNIAIVGKKRSGKTSLLHYVSKITTTPATETRKNQKNNWLRNPEEYTWVYVDFQDKRMTNQGKLLQYILQKTGLQYDHPIDLESFMEIFSSNICKPTVIQFDEVDIAIQPDSPLKDSFWESLRSLGTNYCQGKLSFMLASSNSLSELANHRGYTSPFFNIFGRVIKLGPLTEMEAYELINSSPISFSDSDKAWIIQESRCWPLLIQILCSERLFALEESQTTNNGQNYNWQEQGLLGIESFRYLLA